MLKEAAFAVIHHKAYRYQLFPDAKQVRGVFLDDKE